MDSSFTIFDSSSSDDELDIILAFSVEEERLRNERGSTSHLGSVQRRRFIQWNSLEGHQRLFLDYFAESPVYPPNKFRRRFRMQRSLFNRIQIVIEAHEPYFVQEEMLLKSSDILPFKKLLPHLGCSLMEYQVILWMNI